MVTEFDSIFMSRKVSEVAKATRMETKQDFMCRSFKQGF